MVSHLLLFLSASTVVRAISTLPPGWTFSHSLASEDHAKDPLEFHLALVPADLEGLSLRMHTISEQQDGNGKWLSHEELKHFASPKPENVRATKRFLEAHGIPDEAISSNFVGDVLTIQSTVGQVSKMFNAHFAAFQVHDGPVVARTQHASIPLGLENIVDNVFPISTFAVTRGVGAAGKDFFDGQASQTADTVPQTVGRAEDLTPPAQCTEGRVTPACLREWYGMAGFNPKAGSADIGVAAGTGQYFNADDFKRFMQSYRPEAAEYNVDIIDVIKSQPNNPSIFDGSEAMLDTTIVASQVYPLSTKFFSTGNVNKTIDEFIMILIDHLIEDPKRPGILSVSYGVDEKDLKPGQAIMMCNKIQQLTALGTTVVASSGDRFPPSKVAHSEEDDCPPYPTHFPASCPYVLSVGGSNLFHGGGEAMVDFKPGGFRSVAGFSTIFPAPSYQAKMVQQYKSKHISSQMAPYYNASGRSFPDLVAHSSDYPVYVLKRAKFLRGTSASCPLVASMLALINSARADAGKGTLGWVNPRLYKLGADSGAFYDVTQGGSNCHSNKTGEGFNAATGFDTPSGLGAPRFEQLLKALG